TNNSKSTFAEAVYDVNRVSEITGFNLSQIEDGPLRTVISGSGDLLANLAETTFGDDAVNGPRFATKEGIALGHFVNSEKTSFAVKHFDDWTSIYSAAPNPPAAVLRNIAKWATVPVVNEADGDITYISKSLFAVHSLAGGERTFTVSEKY